MERSVWLPKRANYFFALLPDPVAAASADQGESILNAAFRRRPAGY